MPTETLDTGAKTRENSDAPSTSTESRERGEVLLQRAMADRREKSRGGESDEKPKKKPSEKQPLASEQKPGRDDDGQVAPPKREAATKPVQHTDEGTAQARTAGASQPAAESEPEDAANVEDRVAKAEKAGYEKGRAAGNRDWDQMDARLKKYERDNLTHIETIRQLQQAVQELTQKAYRQGLTFEDLSALDVNAKQREAIQNVGAYYEQQETRAREEAARKQQFAEIEQNQVRERYQIAHDVVQDTVGDLRFEAAKLGVTLSKEEAMARLSKAHEGDDELQTLIGIFNAPTTRPDHAKQVVQTIYKRALEKELGKIQDSVVTEIEQDEPERPQHPRMVYGGAAGGVDPSPPIPKGETGAYLVSQYFSERRKSR